MAPSDSEDETLEELEYDVDDDPEAEGDDEPLDMAPDDATEEGDEESASDDSEDGSEDDDDDEDNDSENFVEAAMDVDQVPTKVEPVPDQKSPSAEIGHPHKGKREHLAMAVSPFVPPVHPPTAPRSLSPEQLRKKALMAPIGYQAFPGSYTVEAICALPHPVPTHALASSLCMTHMLTGSDDGYIRDYDIFSAVNSKMFLTAPQRHHSGVVEGIMKAGQLRFWWENPALPDSTKVGTNPGVGEPSPLSPVYSLAMHSDALWTLAGTDSGHINLFTTRHDPGRVFCSMTGHRGPVSSLSMSHDEKGFFSAGWDGDAIQWDLNNGQRVRTFTAQGAQLTSISVRPLGAAYSEISSTDDITTSPAQQMNGPDSAVLPDHSDIRHSGASTQEPPDLDAKSDASFDPLFDDDPEDQSSTTNYGAPNPRQSLSKATLGLIPPPRNAPPLLDSVTYSTYSPDLLMTASIDGQVILWDQRVDAAGSGVGRLWMSEKTPPWCLSVNVHSVPSIKLFSPIIGRLVGLLMEDRYTLADGTAPLMSGTFGFWDVLAHATHRGF
ncbi:hypothetical protein C0991_003882 [Blastosporella zonata]|nr:hypothetical protein C0991_003882 [Blastosporella zonata]